MNQTIISATATHVASLITGSALLSAMATLILSLDSVTNPQILLVGATLSVGLSFILKTAVDLRRFPRSRKKHVQPASAATAHLAAASALSVLLFMPFALSEVKENTDTFNSRFISRINIIDYPLIAEYLKASSVSHFAAHSGIEQIGSLTRHTPWPHNDYYFEDKENMADISVSADNNGHISATHISMRFEDKTEMLHHRSRILNLLRNRYASPVFTPENKATAKSGVSVYSGDSRTLIIRFMTEEAVQIAKDHNLPVQQLASL